MHYQAIHIFTQFSHTLRRHSTKCTEIGGHQTWPTHCNWDEKILDGEFQSYYVKLF